MSAVGVLGHADRPGCGGKRCSTPRSRAAPSTTAGTTSSSPSPIRPIVRSTPRSHVAVVDGTGLRVDEDWAGDTVYDIGPGETVRDDSTDVFWNVEDVGNPETFCQIVAVYYE